MSIRASEQVALVSLLVVASGLIGAGFWWASDWAGINSMRAFLIHTLRGDDELPALPPVQEKLDAFTDFSNVPPGLFSYGGSTTWAPIRETVDPIIQIAHPQFQLRYTHPTNMEPGSGTGIKMLLDGQLALSQSSRPLEEEEYQKAEQRGYTLNQIPVAIDGIAIAVHQELGIPGLTIDQLKGIYTGSIDNWRQVGGPDLPITPYSRSTEAGGTVEFFVENVLNSEDFGPNVVHVFDTTDGLKRLIEDPGGIYYATATQIVPQCKVKPLPIGYEADQYVAPYETPFISLNLCPNQRNRLDVEAIQSGEYPITRRLFVIVKQNGQEDEQAGMAYAALLLSDQGQELIKDAGFVGLR